MFIPLTLKSLRLSLFRIRLLFLVAFVVLAACTNQVEDINAQPKTFSPELSQEYR